MGERVNELQITGIMLKISWYEDREPTLDEVCDILGKVSGGMFRMTDEPVLDFAGEATDLEWNVIPEPAEGW